MVAAGTKVVQQIDHLLATFFLLSFLFCVSLDQLRPMTKSRKKCFISSSTSSGASSLSVRFSFSAVLLFVFKKRNATRHTGTTIMPFEYRPEHPLRHQIFETTKSRATHSLCAIRIRRENEPKSTERLLMRMKCPKKRRQNEKRNEKISFLKKRYENDEEKTTKRNESKTGI